MTPTSQDLTTMADTLVRLAHTFNRGRWEDRQPQLYGLLLDAASRIRDAVDRMDAR